MKSFFMVIFCILFFGLTLNLIDAESLGNLDLLEVKEIHYQEDSLNISYVFDNSNLIGDSSAVEIWILGYNKTEVKRIRDVFNINRDSPIKRNIIVELPKDSAEIYEIYFALPSDLEKFVKVSLVLGGSSITGGVILDDPKNEKVIAVVILFAFLIAGFFLLKFHNKKKSYIGSVEKIKNKNLVLKRDF